MGKTRARRSLFLFRKEVRKLYKKRKEIYKKEESIPGKEGLEGKEIILVRTKIRRFKSRESTRVGYHRGKVRRRKSG